MWLIFYFTSMTPQSNSWTSVEISENSHYRHLQKLLIKWYKNKCCFSKFQSCYIMNFLAFKNKYLEWYQQNGGEGSSTVPFLHRNVEKQAETVGTNFEKIVSVWQQQSKCWTKKTPIKKWWEGFVAFFLVSALYLPQLGNRFEQQLTFPVWDQGPWFQREKSRLYIQITVFVYSNLPGSFLKNWCKALRSRDWIKIKNFCASKDILNGMNRTPTKWQKIVENHIYDKDLIPRRWRTSVTQQKQLNQKTHQKFSWKMGKMLE